MARKVIVILTAVAAAILVAAMGVLRFTPTEVRNVPIGRKPIFVNRAAHERETMAEFFMQDHTRMRFDDPLPFCAQDSSQCVALHTAFSESVLMIRQTSVVDNAIFQSDPRFGATTGDWAFPKVIQLALGTDAGKDAAASQQWLKDFTGAQQSEPGYAVGHLNCAWRQLDPKQNINNFPVRLSAVVNRLDLAQVTGTQMSGAEIRFVYSALADSDLQSAQGCGNNSIPTLRLTLIVEFVLPPMPQQDSNGTMGFQTLYKTWAALLPSSGSAPDLGKLASALSTTLGLAAARKFASARLRLNGGEDAAVAWKFAQYNLPDSTPDVLDQQPSQNGACVKSGDALASFIDNNWSTFTNSDFSLIKYTGTGIAATTALISDSSDAKSNVVLTLDQSVLPTGANPSTLETARFAASVYSCAGCHSFETERTGNSARNDDVVFSSFDQVRYRERNTGLPSQLSPFLTGDPQDPTDPNTPTDHGDPTIQYRTVNPPLDTPPVDPGSYCNATPRPSQFNDLLRRHLYGWVILNNTVDQWASTLPDYIALQPH